MVVNVPISVPTGFAADPLKIPIASLAPSSFNETGETIVDRGTQADPLRLRLAEAVPDVPAAVADSAVHPKTPVCCHWKNKGFCTYQKTCKYLHPEHKCGVGAGARKKKRA